jgi:hypothetical protein
MGDLVDINEWVEKRVNKLAQKFRCCKDKTRSRELECVLKEWGHKRARYKTHYLRTQRERERERDENSRTED